MTQGQAGWLFLLIASICIFLIGMQGSLGVFIAIIFSPSAVTTSEAGTPITGTNTWQGVLQPPIKASVTPTIPTVGGG